MQLFPNCVVPNVIGGNRISPYVSSPPVIKLLAGKQIKATSVYNNSFFYLLQWTLTQENMSSGFMTKQGSKRPVQLQRLARILKVGMKQV